MPHVVVKLWPGPTETQKEQLAARIVRDVIDSIGSSDASISVAIEEVRPERWTAEVYDSEIAPNMETLYKRPGYQRL